jgi:hypothetical protein
MVRERWFSFMCSSHFCLEYKLLLLVKIDFARNSCIVLILRVRSSSDNVALLATL